MSLFFCCKSECRDLTSSSLSSNTDAILRDRDRIQRALTQEAEVCFCSIYVQKDRQRQITQWNDVCVDYFSCCSCSVSWFFLRVSLCLVSEMWAACSSFSSRSLSLNLHRRSTRLKFTVASSSMDVIIASLLFYIFSYVLLTFYLKTMNCLCCSFLMWRNNPDFILFWPTLGATGW